MTDLFSSAADQDLLSRTRQFLDDISREIPVQEAFRYIEDLRAVISEHDVKYYKESTNIISDHEYDTLFKRLKSLEERYPDLSDADSPTQKLGDQLSEGFKTVLHLVPMLSLDNSYNLEDLQKFDKRVRDGLPSNTVVKYTVEPKYDGSSIALVYQGDELVRGATRGNGVAGDDITANVRMIPNVPKKAPFSSYGIYKIEVRGEAIIRIPLFEQLNQQRIQLNEELKAAGKKELELFKNPRNTAAGSLRMKDPEEVKRRMLEVIIYQVGYAENVQGRDITDEIKSSHSEYLQLLKDVGFNTPGESVKIFEKAEDLSHYCLEWQERRDTFPIDIDGMVIKVDSIRQQIQLGKTSHHPKWAIAYKFKARQAFSTLRRVDYQVGRTGAVTPVAKIDPVQLMGVEISSISLHNADFIAEKNILLGDTVIVERAGDVIPYIVAPVAERRNGSEQLITFPENCPSCSHHLVRPDDESAWRCINPDCPAQIEERLIHFVSVNAMDIQGLGQEIIRTFLREGIIRTISDIYQLDYDKILALEGFKTKSVQNLKQSIEASKENESWRLLTGLGIRHVGSTTAKMLAREVELLTDFSGWSLDQFMELKDIGPKVASSLADFFHDEDNIALIQSLADLGVNIRKTEVRLASEKLVGKTFLFTGTLPSISRDEGKALVEANGGKVLSSVSSNLNYLVAGEKAGSKLTKAEKIATIEIIDEATFLQMIS